MTKLSVVTDEFFVCIFSSSIMLVYLQFLSFISSENNNHIRCLRFLIIMMLTWAHIVWTSGKFIAYIHSPIYSFGLNSAAEMVYQCFRLKDYTENGDLSRQLLQAAYSKRVTQIHLSVLLQNYLLKKAKPRLCDSTNPVLISYTLQLLDTREKYT